MTTVTAITMTKATTMTSKKQTTTLPPHFGITIWQYMGHKLILIIISVVIPSLLISCGGSETGTINTSQLAEGKILYEANCASCHGINGEGEENWQSPNDDGTLRAPPHDSTGHTWHHPDQLLLQITSKGGKGLNSRMPAFEDQLTEEEIKLTLEYIKTFWEPEHRESQADVTERMEEASQQ